MASFLLWSKRYASPKGILRIFKFSNRVAWKVLGHSQYFTAIKWWFKSETRLRDNLVMFEDIFVWRSLGLVAMGIYWPLPVGAGKHLTHIFCLSLSTLLPSSRAALMVLHTGHSHRCLNQESYSLRSCDTLWTGLLPMPFMVCLQLSLSASFWRWQKYETVDTWLFKISFNFITNCISLISIRQKLPFSY